VNADDNRLISECLAGNTAAFGELVTRYQDRLYNTVFRLVNQPEDARDAVQEAFLSAYQSLSTFKGDSLFFTWLYRIAINTAISLKRKQRAALRLTSGLESGTLNEPVDPSDLAQPGRALEMAEDEKIIHQALNRLSAEHRTVLVLKDMEGRKYEDMADILEVPIGTIRSRLHRARLELRDILLQDEKKVEHR
jgi:RNA polymerase sigma-70 factor, ECF subfamily